MPDMPKSATTSDVEPTQLLYVEKPTGDMGSERDTANDASICLRGDIGALVGTVSLRQLVARVGNQRPGEDVLALSSQLSTQSGDSAVVY